MASFEIDQEAVARDLMPNLQRADPRPILEQMAKLLAVSPDLESLAVWATKYPDRWAAAVTMLARLGGYTEKREVSIDVTFDLSRLSDSQLAQRVAEVSQKLLAKPTVIDVEPTGSGE